MLARETNNRNRNNLDGALRWSLDDSVGTVLLLVLGKLKGKAVSPQIEISTQSYRTSALFWGSKKFVKHQPVDSSLGDLSLASGCIGMKWKNADFVHVVGSDEECSEGKEGGRTNGGDDVIMEMLGKVIAELGGIKES
ncbi:hypothetical protein V6N13_118490 [Hibiscus sabdariffa]